MTVTDFDNLTFNTCCCPTPDARICVAIRYNKEIEDVGADDGCYCACHQEWDEEEDEQPILEREPTPQEEQEALDELQVTDPEMYNYIKHAGYDPEPGDDDATNEDELPHLEISPLALPQRKKRKESKDDQ